MENSIRKILEIYIYNLRGDETIKAIAKIKQLLRRKGVDKKIIDEI